jgi:hypothetical protein
VLLEARGIALEVDVDPDLIWHLDEDLIVGVVSHAVNNAVHYTRDRIRLAMREAGGCSSSASRTMAPAIRRPCSKPARSPPSTVPPAASTS